LGAETQHDPKMACASGKPLLAAHATDFPHISPALSLNYP
jgi:hypothetical protein